MAVAQIKRVKIGKGAGGVLRPEQVKPALDKGLKELALMIKEFIITSAQAPGKHNYRKDKAGFVGNTKVTFDTDGVVMSLPVYAQYIDSGRKKGARKIPIAAIIAWIKRYRVGGRQKPSGKFSKNNSVNSLAFAIQNAIFKSGIRARPFIEQSVTYAQELLAQTIDEIMIPSIISIIEFQFNKK